MTRGKTKSSAKGDYRLTMDLRWFFNDSATDLGFSSTFGSFLKGMFSPGHEPYTETFYTDALLRKIARHRRIHQALMQCYKLDYRRLTAIYLDDYQSKYPRAIKNVFEAKAGLAICLFGGRSDDNEVLRTNLTKLIDLCAKDNHNDLQGKEKWDFQTFKDQVNLEFDKLHSLLRKIIK
jgi:hypothetical protein